MKPENTCEYYYDCCSCGGGSDCGCSYCWDCNACEDCLNDNESNCDRLSTHIDIDYPKDNN